MSDTQYPLNIKLERVSDLTHAIANFLEWAEKQKGLRLCEAYKPQYSWFVPIHTSKEQLLLEFFDINPAELEIEKKQMTDEYIKLA
ncbi:hypothetical protein SCT_0760 [Sulfuricella sp. T08]|uniref:hypothetical protein n=1 Tax=Sulfuricella sp. T08 TaxID=1632857 RepID=UPI000617A1B9|nr:hypothetical protein [Sulfuricella sp. T08]GAO35374.1 hypothetical protein SCT_0760 [Sulfuricella sp. T08]